MKDNNKILMAHGGGGILTQRLIQEHILPRLGNDTLNPLMDSAVLPPQSGRICMTTDGYVVQPIEFPGGDIGKLSICGTVNDLAVMGATPLGISLSLVLEEGLPIVTLDRVLDSIAAAAKEAGVNVVTGDTKVIEHQGSYGLTITTAGVGVLPAGRDYSIKNIEEGDVLIINGDIADHGIAVMSAREDLQFNTSIKTDCAPLNGLIGDIIETGAEIRFMRDLTRAGLAGALVDICEDTELSVEIDETAIPINRATRHTAEMLGLDPVTIANEGKIIVAVAEQDADKVLAACRKNSYGKKAAVIGRTSAASPNLVELITRAGGRRMIQRPYGEDLPRIC